MTAFSFFLFLNLLKQQAAELPTDESKQFNIMML